MWSYKYVSSELQHGLFNFGKKKEDYKYVDKYKSKKGNWVYIYADKLKKVVSNTAGKVKTAAENTLDKAIDYTNKTIDKADKAYSDLYKSNKYMTNNWNIESKKKEIAKTKEWQDIVNRKDPEYVKKNADGSYTYDMDEYITNKKHPILDALKDITYGRKITINKVTPESLLAAGNDVLEYGMAYVALRAQIVDKALKFRQGSYAEEIKDVKNTSTDLIGIGTQVVSNILTNTAAVQETDPQIAAISSAIEFALASQGYKKEDVINRLMDSQKVKETLEAKGVSMEDLKEIIEKAYT